MDRNALKNFLIFFSLYSLLLLFIGRQLSFIPQIKLGSTPKVHAEDIRKDVLEKFLKGEKGSYTIYYKNLVTGEEFGIDENKVTTAASLNKVPIVAYLYNQANQDKIDLEDKIAIQESDIQDYGTGSLRYQKPGGSYSLKNLTKLAMEQSDNTAAHVLNVRLGIDKIQAFVDKIGLKATDMEKNYTSARDMGRIFELIYEKKVANEALTSELLDFMKDTDFEDRLARNMPAGVSVYHKAADGIGFVHDVGIVEEGNKKFILTILSSDIRSEEEAKEIIGKIAEFIYTLQK